MGLLELFVAFGISKAFDRIWHAGPLQKLHSHELAGLSFLSNRQLQVVLTLRKKFYGSYLWMGFHSLKTKAILRMQFIFYHYVLRNLWYSLYWPRKDERLSRPLSHTVVWNMGPLDWESSAFWMGMVNFHKNIELILEFLNASFLGLHFSYYTLMTLLIISFVTLPYMLLILFSTLCVIRHLICGNN